MDKKRHVAIWLRMLASKEITAARRAKSLLKAQGNKIVNAYKEGGEIEALQVVRKSELDWVRLFVAIYGGSIQDFGSYIVGVLGVKKQKSNLLDLSREWISSQAYLKSFYVNATTQEIVKRVIDDGLINGLSEIEIANNLKEHFVGDVGTSRARTIARTEVHNSASWGMQAAAENTGLALEREWVAVSDERTREDHAEVDGTVVAMDEPWLVGDESLDYPGDGSPEQSINCRCTIAYNRISGSDSGGE